jgi:apolipoprotein D and lipocalin family protein
VQRYSYIGISTDKPLIINSMIRAAFTRRQNSYPASGFIVSAKLKQGKPFKGAEGNLELITMTRPLISAFFLFVMAVFSVPASAADLKTVPYVDMDKYLGRWYEIAKYPNRFQRQCVGNTMATYSLKPNGRIEVLNECLKTNGKVESATGEARIADKKSNAKLKVRFAPGFLSFLPFVWANYWIIDLAPDYSYAVIGEPKREYFWILSRLPEMQEEKYVEILKRVEAMGFDPTKVDRTRQGIATQ